MFVLNITQVIWQSLSNSLARLKASREGARITEKEPVKWTQWRLGCKGGRNKVHEGPEWFP